MDAHAIEAEDKFTRLITLSADRVPGGFIAQVEKRSRTLAGGVEFRRPGERRL